MKEFRSFLVNERQKWEKLSADKSVDEAIQLIVANAKKYKNHMETAEPQRQALFSTVNYKKVCHLLLAPKRKFLIVYVVISPQSPMYFYNCSSRRSK